MLTDTMTKAEPNAAADLLERHGEQRFRTILADPPWQFQNRTGKMAPEQGSGEQWNSKPT